MMVQSSDVQHVVDGIQLFDAGQTFLPAPQPQLPPGPEHVSPVTVQSAVVQHVLDEMQLDDARHAVKPDRQLHCWPGLGQTSPEIAVQSDCTQQVPLSMQLDDAWHVCWLAGHRHMPDVGSHVWPRYGHCSGRYVQLPPVQTALTVT